MSEDFVLCRNKGWVIYCLPLLKILKAQIKKAIKGVVPFATDVIIRHDTHL